MKNILLLSILLILSACSIKENTLTTEEMKKTNFSISHPTFTSNLSKFTSSIPFSKTCTCDYNQFSFTEDSNISFLKLTSASVWMYAIMSNNAYAIDSEKPQVELPNWKRISRYQDKGNSGFSADIYELNTNPLRVVIAYRGTDNLPDFKSNLSLGKRRQYAIAEQLYQEVRKKYEKNIKIDVTGHSLGGGLAISISLRYKEVDSYVFNSSPRVFANKTYNNNGNSINLINESGEVLAWSRNIFKTIKNIKPNIYKYNLLEGFPIKEHGITNLSRCLYAVNQKTHSEYAKTCKEPNYLRYLF